MENSEKDLLKDYSLKDLIDIPKVKALMEKFYELIKAPTAILDNNNEVLVAIGWQRICKDFHRINPESCKRCKQSDAVIFNHLHERKFLKYKCKNGLWDFAYPLIIEDQHLGTVFLGQCMLENDKTDTEFFREQAKMFGYDTDDYLKALEEVPVFSLEYMEKLMNWAIDFSQLLAEQGLDNYYRKKEIGHRKEIEKELNEYKDHLESLVKKRTKQLTETNRLLREEIKERIRAEKELNSEKALIDDYINSLPGLFYVFDEKKFVKWNNRWNIVTEYSDEELSNMYAPDFFEDDMKQTIYENMKRVFSQGATNDELDIVTKSGKKVPYYFTGVLTDIAGPQLVGLGIDISDRKLAEEEKEQLIVKLRQTLEQVKQLKGLIPICAKCKKIRDDKGYWNNLEQYIEKHSDAQFSHGLCGECTETLYGKPKRYQEKE